jgi:small ligand-binding sensory domain FIST
MKWASAISLENQTDAALREVIGAIEAQLNGAVPDVAFLFVSPHHRAAAATLSHALYSQLGIRHLLGCTGGGIIGGGSETEQVASVSLTCAVMPHVNVHLFRIEDGNLPDPDSPPRAWEDMVGVKNGEEQSFVLLADPFSIGVDELLAGLDYAFPKSIKIGGLASGARRPGQNALFVDHKIFHSGAVGLALSGNVRVDTLVAQGCRPIGTPMRISRCVRNVLIELDRKPALEMLSTLFQESNQRDQQLIRTSLFLGLVMDPFKTESPQTGDFLIRNLVGMDTEHNALVISAVLREGQTVQFHVRDAVAASDDIAAVLKRFAIDHLQHECGNALPPSPRGALLFSCLGRGVHMYGRPNHDSDAFTAELGSVPLGGFFCNGEIGPVDGTTYIHGFTSCFGIFSPRQYA